MATPHQGGGYHSPLKGLQFSPHPRGVKPLHFPQGFTMSNVVLMSPTDYLRLALPFGFQGGPRCNEERVEYYRHNPYSCPMLSVKQGENGLQVGIHDGRHRAVSCENEFIEVEIVRGKRFSRENPLVSDSDIAGIVIRDGLISEDGTEHVKF